MGIAETQWQEVTGDMTQLESQGSGWYPVLHFFYPFHKWACRVLGISIWGKILRYTGAICLDVPQLGVMEVGDWPCSQGASGIWGGTSFLVECHIWPQCCFHHGPWAFVFFFKALQNSRRCWGYSVLADNVIHAPWGRGQQLVWWTPAISTEAFQWTGSTDKNTTTFHVFYMKVICGNGFLIPVFYEPPPCSLWIYGENTWEGDELQSTDQALGKTGDCRKAGAS